MSSISQAFQGFVTRRPTTVSSLTPPPNNGSQTRGSADDDDEIQDQLQNPVMEPEPPRPRTGAADTPLAKAITLLAQILKQPAPQPSSVAQHERNNTREPDQFDGLDPKKLRPFLVQLELVFKARPRTFTSDKIKVIYTISYLKGITLQWFKPYLLESDSGTPPNFLYNYEAFKMGLRGNFGPFDTTGAAEAKLENLRMFDNQKINKYIANFTRLRTEVPWDESALR